MDIIVDIDGTIADMRHRRHLVDKNQATDWPKFFEAMIHDLPIKPMRLLIESLMINSQRIILCTGRPDNYREHTTRWCVLNCFGFDELYMRKEKDYRPDYVVKEEMLWQMKADGYSPQLAIEDKQECVDMWRRNGILTLQNSMREMP